MSERENTEITAGRDWRDQIAHLQRKIENLQQKTEQIDQEYEGLKDLNLQFDLIITELQAVLSLTKRSDFSETLEMRQLAREYALHALDTLEDITAANISLDQRSSIEKSPELKKANI